MSLRESVKIINIVGARPQFIKASSVSRAIHHHNEKSPSTKIVEKILHTGQHYDENMSRVFFDELEIPEPVWNLGVGSGFHGEQTGLMLGRIEDVLLKEKPDLCFVYGDTNSTLAGALASVKIHIPVGHIEAGLRSFNRKMPEEINRVVVDHISDILLCPTEKAVENLKNEGITNEVYKCGDVMYDCTLFYRNKSKTIEQKTFKRFDIQSKSYYLATVHRAENTDDKFRLRQIIEAFNEMASVDCPVLLPLHPRTVERVDKYGLKFVDEVKVVKPVSYLEMLVLEENSRVILTDSGGMQKEAFFLGVPCVTLREETEWVETVVAGFNVLTGADRKKIVEQTSRAVRLQKIIVEDIYGKGDAAEKIVGVLLDFLR